MNTKKTPPTKPVSQFRRAYLADLARLNIKHSHAVIGTPQVRRSPRKRKP